MATANLTWTPAGGANSLSQDVQYKVSTSSTWITHSNVGPSINTATITGLLDNTVYDFRVINNCSVGGPTPATQYQTVNLTCPVVTVTPSYDSIGYSFTHLGASVDSYTVELLNASDGVVATINELTPSGTVTNSFTGLTASTVYKVRVTVKVGSTFSKQCTATTTGTIAAPTCDPPTGVSATMS
jgi:hypothetical protein